MGCQPQGSSHLPSHLRPGYTVSSLSHPADTVLTGHPHSPRLYPAQPLSHPATTPQQYPLVNTEAASVHRTYPACSYSQQTFVTSVCESTATTQPDYYHQVPSDHLAQHHHQQQRQQHIVKRTAVSQQFWGSDSASLEHRLPPPAGLCQHTAFPPHTGSSHRQPLHSAPYPTVTAQRQSFVQSVRAGVPPYYPPTRLAGCAEQASPQPYLYRAAEETALTQRQVSRPADSSAQQQPLSGSAHPRAVRPQDLVADPTPHTVDFVTAAPAQGLGQHPEAAALGKSSQPAERVAEGYHQLTTSTTQQQTFPRSPATMLDKKPVLQVVTTDRSPVSPGSSTSSPRFIFPEVHALSSSCHLASHSHTSPFMSPIKKEVSWEVGSPPQPSQMETEMQQVHTERHRVLSGDTDRSDTLVDSETGSSVLEDSSSSSREQSPFSTMTESLSLRSPSQHLPSPLTRKTLQRQMVIMVSEDEEQGQETDGGEGVPHSSSTQHDAEFHHSKFKKRLHERYMLSQKDASEVPHTVKEEAVDRYELFELENHQDCERPVYERLEVESQQDSKRPVTKWEGPDSLHFSEGTMPKSPRRSSSDMDMVHMEGTEMGAISADEGDVFMEPTTRVRTKHKPPSLHQREPLDLSRSPYIPGIRSSPHIDTEYLNPGSRLFSPVFRSPHRLPYSPHGLSPQAQSPLCSVPEGGRIFNFNVPSPREGAHSDSDIISPSPLSPRIFTFPPQGSIVNSMSEVNRLAVSPRAPYTPPPSFMRGKPFIGAGGLASPKWGDEHGFYSKRSLSESDMTYLCPVCGQVFPTNDNLAKHMAKHLSTETIRSGDNKLHYCKVCSRSFSRSDMLTRHMRLHTGLKPYECVDCGQVFSRSDHLNTHRRTHTGEKPYRCPHCPYAACRRDMITRHLRTHAKRTSRRGRYLSVPEDGDKHKPSGSISSLETTDSQDYSTGGHTCSISSVDSVECESIQSSQPSYLGASVDSLLSPVPDRLSVAPLPSPASQRRSELSGEGSKGQEGGTDYYRFMRYRKGRNWSTTSLESVDSEEAALLREVLVDDAFQDTDPQPCVPGEWGRGESVEKGRRDVSSTDCVGPETKTLQNCSISLPHTDGSR